jgi:hypothetical protein
MQVLPNDSDGHDVEYRTLIDVLCVGQFFTPFAFCVCSLNLHVRTEDLINCLLYRALLSLRRLRWSKI